MSKYRTCFGCAFGNGPCAERNKLRDQIAGLGLTSVKWKCAWRRPEFRPGQPVRVTAMDRDEGYDDGIRIDYVDGFFVRYATYGSKVVVFVEPDEFRQVFDGAELQGNGYMKLARSYVTARDGVPASVCQECGNVSDRDQHGDWCKHHPKADEIAKSVGYW